MRIVYIAGAAHCGSTLLDLFLGQHSDVLSAGQLSEIAGCVTECGDINEPHVERSHLETWAKALLALSRSERLFLRTSLQEITKEKGLIGFVVSRAKRKRYAEGLVPLLKSLREHNPNKAVIVDSSKNITRALALNELEDVTVVHLVRDGHGYVGSKLWRQGGAIPPFHSFGYGLYWALKNLAASVLLKRAYGNQCITIRYEDFVSDPLEVVKPVLRSAKIDGLEPYQRAVREGIAGRPLLGGNRIRLLENQKIDPERARPAALPAPHKWLFNLSAGPVRKMFGY